MRKKFHLVIETAHRPVRISELLTAQEACRRFGIRTQRLYALADADLLHPVRPHGRILYPEWEIAAALRAVNGAIFLFDPIADAVA